jgi:hypothetical protein
MRRRRAKGIIYALRKTHGTVKASEPMAGYQTGFKSFKPFKTFGTLGTIRMVGTSMKYSGMV